MVSLTPLYPRVLSFPAMPLTEDLVGEVGEEALGLGPRGRLPDTLPAELFDLLVSEGPELDQRLGSAASPRLKL